MNRIQQIVASLCLFSLASVAAAHPTSIGYLYDSQGNLVHTGYGGCVRTAEWAPANALPECDGTAPSAPATKPAAAPETKAAPVAKAAPSIIKIELSADESFETNKAELSADAKAKLSELAKQLNGLNYDRIVITGHADRSGSAAGNQQLSERRANAAHNYLVSEGVSSAKMSSSGKGSSQPLTKPGACDKLKSKQLRACLAPDRRVEIRVTGTRSK
ncbi:MAG TPA: OmpA family protein [Gallionella sp.]|nr:OmpA family protein [Gallionella sp.]